MAQSVRVTLIDDEATLLEVLGRLLDEDGYVTRLFTSSLTALDACVAEPPHVVVVDFRMHEMNGSEFARRLRAALGERTPQLLCVTGNLSGLGPEDQRVFDRILRKPFAYQDLVRVLEELLRSRPNASGERLRLPWVRDHDDPDEVAG